MLYNGATVEEVKEAIDKKEAEKRAIQEKAKKEAIEEHKTRDIKQRVETAEALAKAGVISKQDLENIKKEAEKEFENLNKASQDMANSDNVKEKDDKPKDETDKGE
jgi:multidrug resistance efflux pump